MNEEGPAATPSSDPGLSNRAWSVLCDGSGTRAADTSTCVTSDCLGAMHGAKKFKAAEEVRFIIYYLFSFIFKLC